MSFVSNLHGVCINGARICVGELCERGTHRENERICWEPQCLSVRKTEREKEGESGKDGEQDWGRGEEGERGRGGEW